MAKALIALIGLLAVLLIPAPAAAGNSNEFLFHGGGDPFDGKPIVGMSMTGEDPDKPHRVTGFTVSGFNWECGGEIGSVPADLVSLPISLNPKAARTRRTKDKQRDLYFSWSYEHIYRPGVTLSSYQLVGGQHRKHHQRWVGKVRVRQSEGGIEFGYCKMEGADEDGYLHWEANLVKACPGECASPFSSEGSMELPANAAASTAHASRPPVASQSRKKCKRRGIRKRRKCKHKAPPHVQSPPPPPPSAPAAGPAWNSGRYTGSYAENATELRFNVVGTRLYTGAFDSFFIYADCGGGYFDPSAIAPVEASISATGDFTGSGVYSPGFGIQIPWQISGHLAGKSLTNGVFSAGPYMDTFGDTCSGTTHFVAQWFADYTL